MFKILSAQQQDPVLDQAQDPSSVKPSRRRFVKAAAASPFVIQASAGGALALGFGASSKEALAQGQAQAVGGSDLAAWVYIKPNEEIVVRIARSEMGQGTLTGLAQLVAEELDCDWSKVRWEYPTPGANLARKRVWGDMSTGGSRGIRGSHDYVRQGGAAARLMLIQAAANEWNVPASECTTEACQVMHKASNRTTTYGKLAEAAAKLPVPDFKSIKLKDSKDWKIAGKSLKRLDTVDKLTGKQIYGIDLTMPGMLNASIKDTPVHGGKLKSFDASKAKVMPGVKHVLQVGAGAVAVVADTWWQANSALQAVTMVYEDDNNTKVDSASMRAVVMKALDAPEEQYVGNQTGDAKGAMAKASKKISAVYHTQYIHHTTMEPMNCTAKWTPDKCEVWVPTQNGDASLATCSQAAGLPIEKCDVYKVHLGGGFGRRGKQDYVEKAVLLAKQLPGVPIKMIWSREEDQRQGWFRPLSSAKMEAGLDDKGNLQSLTMRIAGPSILNTVVPQRMENGNDWIAFQGLWPNKGPRGPEGGFGYTIPNMTLEFAMRNFHVRPGFWRGVNNNQNCLYIECFLDEVAKAAGKDPLEFRRAMMQEQPKHLAVLNAVATKISDAGPAAPGRFRGYAQQMGFGSYVGAAAEVSVNAKNEVTVHRLVVGTDSGYVVNPDQVDAQIVGSVAYGLSGNFMENITIKNGAVQEENLNSYDIMRLADFPKRIETVLIPSGGFWGGVGEPTIMVAAPAVLNAVFAATGKMTREFPATGLKLKS
jgi:isoquinoline 1-oxidoreductase subunit beta